MKYNGDWSETEQLFANDFKAFRDAGFTLDYIDYKRIGITARRGSGFVKITGPGIPLDSPVEYTDSSQALAFVHGWQIAKRWYEH